ncbi:F-box protein PP2-A13-like [Phragmites australis]|uniref:F-box protein PP2-A13-like n=1 Tax=Phragmites australis TaxID=29695 RepID=UPI002D79A637|nr:F-box protein PP2-A13-like [Phragmites australis]
MGAGASSMMGPEGYGRGRSQTSLGDMPESCVALVLLYLDPQEICLVARLNRAFRGAASADCVWAAKLPANYRYLAALAAAADDECGCDESTEGNGRCCSSAAIKKEIYARLCRPTPFHGGTKEFWIEKNSGGLCLSISSKAMAITCIDDRRYWSLLPTEESRFHSVSYLQQIWWLEVVGEIDFCFPAGSYSLFFRLHLGLPRKRMGRRVSGSELIHGWDIKPTQFQLSTSDDQHSTSERYLERPGTWILYHVGDFVVSSSDELTKLKFSMMQIDCTHTKGGLCVDSVFIYPKDHQHEKERIICK